MGDNDLTIEYIPLPVDVLVVNGIRYSGDLFRGFASIEIGKVLEIIERKDGVIHVRNHARPFWKLTSEEEPPQKSVLVSTPTGGYFIARWNPDWQTWCKTGSYDIVDLSCDPIACYWQEIIPPRDTKSAP